MPDKTYTKADLDAAVRAARGGDSTNLDEIAKRPYHTIYTKEGTVLCYPPSEGGPIALDGQHPDDFYGVEEADDVKGGKTFFATKKV